MSTKKLKKKLSKVTLKDKQKTVETISEQLPKDNSDLDQK